MFARRNPADRGERAAPYDILAFVKAWHAATAALLFLVPPASTAADDLPGAARELAQKTSALVRGPINASYRNLSSLPDSEIAELKRQFQAALVPPAESGPPAEARLTLSENAAQYLVIEEIRKGEDAQVWISAWKRSEAASVSAAGLNLERTLIWEQDEPILDVAIGGDGIVVLSPSRIVFVAKQGGPRGTQSAPLTPARPWPRDLRGRLRINGAQINAYLPGTFCQGTTEPSLSVQCRASEDPWVLESGSRGILLGNFAADRNYFDGRVVTQNGTPKTVAPFFSAAAVEEQGALFWLLSLVDGRAQVFDSGLQQPVAAISGWGSDLVGISARCLGGSQVLATRAADAAEPDAIQAFGLANHAAVALTAPIAFAGPVTALWPSGSSAALAVARDLGTGKYAAYLLTLVCGR